MRRLFLFLVTSMVLSVLLVACGNGGGDAGGTSTPPAGDGEPNAEESTENEGGVVNLYSSRHYDTDEALYELFTEQTGIKVNVVQGKSDELVERLKREGEQTEADLFITADAGNLHRAKESDLLQPVESETLLNQVPENLRDVDGYWFGLTKRARVIVYAKDRVDPAELSTYEALTQPEWEGRVLVRSSENMYNISLLASFIAQHGEDQAREWAAGIVNNMAQPPQGGDRDQAKAVAAGIGDVAIMNTYYIGGMLNSADPEEVKVAESVGIFFPNQEDGGTHINISGIGLTKHAKNKEAAIRFMEFLSGPEAQQQFAEANYEYPVNPEVEPAPLLQSWGEFKEQELNLSVLGENQQAAIRIFNEVGWK